MRTHTSSLDSVRYQDGLCGSCQAGPGQLDPKRDHSLVRGRSGRVQGGFVRFVWPGQTLRLKTGPLGPFPRTPGVQKVRPGPKIDQTHFTHFQSELVLDHGSVLGVSVLPDTFH